MLLQEGGVDLLVDTRDRRGISFTGNHSALLGTE